MKAIAQQVEVQAPTRHKVTLKRKDQLIELLKNSRGQTYQMAVSLYWYLRSFHNPTKARKQNGNVISITKLHTDGLHLNRAELAKALGCSKRSISRNIAILERFRLIARDYTKQGRAVNHLVIYVLRNTPHFYNEYSISENRIRDLKPHTNSAHIEERFGVKFNPQNIGFSIATASVPYCQVGSTDNLEVEEVVFQTTTSTTLYYNSQNKKNNIYLVENSTPETPLKKSSFENDFYANSEQAEISTYCEDTAGNDMPDYATADFELPRKITDNIQTSPDTKQPLPQPTASEIPESQPVPIASSEERTNQMVSMQDLMQLIPKPTIATKEEDIPMALPEKKQDLRQHLNYEIHRTFPKATSENLQESLVITPIGPNKIGVKFNKKTPLKTDEKDQLRQCIKVVYGDSIFIVAVGDKPKIQEVIKPAMPSVEDTENRSNTMQPIDSPEYSKWQEIKDHVLASVYDNAREYIKYALAQTDILSLNGRKLKLSAKYSVCDKLGNHQSLIEKAAAKYDVDIELKNTSDNDTLYFPWVFNSATLSALTLEKN